MYPHAILGRNSNSNDGNIVILDQIGIIKVGQLTKFVDEEEIIGYTMQRLLHLNEHVVKGKERVVWIFDLAGKIMQLASKKNYAIF